MKKIKLMLTVILLMTFKGFSQGYSYKINFSGADKQVQIYTGTVKLQIVGTNGSEVIIETDQTDIEKPEEAEGLKLVTPGGQVDNTGVGANFEIKASILKIKIPKSKYYGIYTIKIPKNLNVLVRESNNSYASWLIEEMAGEVDIKTSYTNTIIKNVTGPVIANAGYGKLDVSYATLDQKRPNSITGNSSINVVLPADSKANIKMSSSYGDVFTDFELKQIEEKNTKTNNKEEKTVLISSTKNGVNVMTNTKEHNGVIKEHNVIISEHESTTEDIEKRREKAEKDREKAEIDRERAENKKYSYSFTDSDCFNCKDSDHMVSTINGGGVSIKIVSHHGNVYLRKKK